MPIIIVSADNPGLEKEIANETAARLGFTRLGPELLTEVARSREIEEQEFIRAFEEAPGFFGMNAKRRRELLTYIQAECLERLAGDRIVCYGLGAHLYVLGVSHALRARILTDPMARAAQLAEGKNVGEAKAVKLIKTMDQGRRRWSTEYFGIDETDPSLYDIVLNLANLDTDKAVDLICDASGFRKFKPMTYSRNRMQDLILEARVREKIMHQFPESRVQATGGTVVVQVQSAKRDQRKKQQSVRDLAVEVPGVRYVEVHVIKDVIGHAAASER